ncbi:MAG TPA: DNA-directed RNA polymerase subunit K [Candidatus Woesearchaeota archaeon]|nr:DNA-directed RNA polymerase subunit K [Candidatus Woesearchaeota archaeon]
MENLTRYEKARIIGARALQISMGAPILTDRKNEMNPIDIAKKEFAENSIPITIKRDMPEKVEVV